MKEHVESDRLRARVFISCGQMDAEEKKLARDICEMLSGPDFGFDPYVADLEHTQKEVMAAVLDRLESSEYFLLIDFKREKLKRGLFRTRVYRGSLFTHQELAIATFLEIEQLRFSEEGVEWNGISRLLQGKPIQFSDRNHLLRLVRERITKANWTTGWQNGLRIADIVGIDTVPRSNGETAEFYHVAVENLHKRKMALDCRFFCELFAADSTAAPPQALRDHVEQKWAGVLCNQAVAIRPNKGKRRACALFIERNAAGRRSGVYFHQFNINTDSAEAATACPPGEYRLKCSVVSANFPSAQREFKLAIDSAHNVTLEAIVD